MWMMHVSHSARAVRDLANRELS